MGPEEQSLDKQTLYGIIAIMVFAALIAAGFFYYRGAVERLDDGGQTVESGDQSGFGAELGDQLQTSVSDRIGEAPDANPFDEGAVANPFSDYKNPFDN